jgi:hypothetical protein
MYVHTHSAIYAKNTYLMGEGWFVEESKKMLHATSVLQCSVQTVCTAECCRPPTNEISDTRSTHRSVNISEISAEVVILLKSEVRRYILQEKNNCACPDNKYKGK